MTVLDTNRANLSLESINLNINTLLDQAALREEREDQRTYLGASAIGSECLRKCQFDWQVALTHPMRTKMIFERGHWGEEMMARRLVAAGFRMERGTPRCEFTAVGGLFKGHCDAILVDGPPILQYPCLWECKMLGSTGWSKLEREGLAKAYSYYEAQVHTYQAYLDLTNPGLFTAVNSDKMQPLHFIVPFDAAKAQAASDRAVAIIRATQAGELLDRIAGKPSDWRCKLCSHAQRCWSLP